MTEFFVTIVNMSISAGWLVLAVLFLRVLFTKAPKWINVLLWGIVAVRLICPISIESALSLIPSAQTINPEVALNPPIIDSGVQVIDNIVNPVIGEASISFQPEKELNFFKFIMPYLAGVWIIGIVVLFAYTVISYLSLRRKVDTAVRYKDNIFQSENVSSPFVLGIIKPRIYLPFKMNGQDLEHVVAHEHAHIRRKDHWWKSLGFLLLTIHWFNPLMWLAYVLLCRDIELACDEKVIKELGNEQRADYTRALVACSVNRRMIAACPLAFGEVGVKERVKSVMNYKKPAFWIIILAVIACVVVVVVFLTNPKQDSYTLRIVVPAGSQEEFVYSDEEVSTIKNSIKIWSGDGLGDTEVLLSPVNETTETGYTATYLTHGIPVEFDAEKDTWFKIGVNMQNPTDEDIIVYVEVENVEVRIVDEVDSVIEWFDYTENPSAMDDESTIKLPIYPGVTFSYNQTQIIASKPFDTSELTGQTILIDGMPIWNAYFTDLTGDDFPEICATCSFGSGMIDNRITIYDYVNGVSYELSDRGCFDFALRLDKQDGHLYVDKTTYNSEELVETGRLVFKNNCLQIEGFSNEAHQVFQAEILEIHDGYYLVKPVEGSWELSSADRIEVPIRNARPSPEPEVGDAIEIEYSGEILETYPARIVDVYGIRVIMAVSESATRTLTQEEIDEVNETFAPILFDKQGNPMGTNIWSCFFTSYYADIRDMNFAEFLAYFPGDGSVVDDAEFAVLKEKKDFLFYGEVSSLADMPVPVHRYPVRIINLMLKEYAGITVDDLDTSDVNYLSEYDAFYNYTSDAGHGMFTCTRGEIDGDIVRLYEEFDYGTDVLILKKVETGYHIVSHQQLNRN